MTIGKLKEILSRYNDDERILIRDFIFESEIKDIGEQGDVKLTDDDVELVIDMWEDDLERTGGGELEILTSIIYDVNRDNLIDELDKIERWLHTSTEPYDDLDWDGDELVLYNKKSVGDTKISTRYSMEVSERYSRQDLETEGVI